MDEFFLGGKGMESEIEFASLGKFWNPQIDFF